MNRRLKRTLIVLKSYMEQTVFRLLPDELYLKMCFLIYMHQKLDLNNPQTFNEKMQWLKLHDRRTKYTQWADKYLVKQYIADKIGEQYVVPLLGVWDRFEDIDRTALPKQFVLKTTHGSGGIVICRDKETFDWKYAEKKLKRSLCVNYFYNGREWPYKNITPRIIAEQYLENEKGDGGLVDYKFYCFHGIPRFLYVSGGLEDHATARISFCNMDYTKADFRRADYAEFETLPDKPVNFDKMKEFAAMLSADMKFLRVDFFEAKGRLYFSELTFTPRNGFMKFHPKEYDLVWGRELDLSK